jgi:hypothetical protein
MKEEVTFHALALLAINDSDDSREVTFKLLEVDDFMG